MNNARFAELAAGARALTVELQDGNITLETVEGAGWGLTAPVNSTAELDIERDDERIRVRQRREDPPRRIDVALTVPVGAGDAAADGGRMRLTTGRGDITVETDWRGVEVRTGKGEMRLHAPRAVAVEARTGKGDLDARIGPGEATLDTGAGRLTVEGGARRLSAHTGKGDLTVRTGAEDVRVNTGYGSLTVEAPAARNVQAQSGHGEIRCHAPIARLNLHTGSGRLTAEGGREAVAVRTGNGDIVLHGPTGSVEVKTGNGAVEVAGIDARETRVRSGNGNVRVSGRAIGQSTIGTGSGRVEVAAEFGAGRHEVSTGNGDVFVAVSPRARMRLDVQTGAGSVDSAFPLIRVGRAGPPGVGHVRMVGNIGGGEPEADLAARTGRGRVVLARLADAGGPDPAQPTPATVRLAAESEPSPLSPVAGGSTDRGDSPGGQLPSEIGAERAEPVIEAAGSVQDPMLSILASLAEGKISVDEAERLLERVGTNR